MLTRVERNSESLSKHFFFLDLLAFSSDELPAHNSFDRNRVKVPPQLLLRISVYGNNK